MTGILVGGETPSKIMVGGYPVLKVMIADEQVWPSGPGMVTAYKTTSWTAGRNAAGPIRDWDSVDGDAEIGTYNGPANSIILLSEEFIGHEIKVTAEVTVAPSPTAGDQEIGIALGTGTAPMIANTANQTVLTTTRNFVIEPPDFPTQNIGNSRGILIRNLMRSATTARRKVQGAIMTIEVV